MALVKSTLKQAIVAALTAQYDGTPDAEQTQGISDFAHDLATAIDAYIKTATVTTTVVGTCPAGAVTGTGTGSLS